MRTILDMNPCPSFPCFFFVENSKEKHPPKQELVTLTEPLGKEGKTHILPKTARNSSDGGKYKKNPPKSRKGRTGIYCGNNSAGNCNHQIRTTPTPKKHKFQCLSAYFLARSRFTCKYFICKSKGQQETAAQR